MSSESETQHASQIPTPPTDGSTRVSAEVINSYSSLFDELCAERHERGQEKYGPVRFLEPDVDLFEELRLELIDAANYARYHFIRLCLLQDLLAAQQTSTSTPLGQMRDKL